MAHVFLGFCLFSYERWVLLYMCIHLLLPWQLDLLLVGVRGDQTK